MGKEFARDILGKTLGFRDCKGVTLDTMVADGNLRTLGRHEYLVQRGQPFDLLCLVVQGSLETRIIHPDGHRHLISFLQPGEVVGLISVLDGLGHINDLVAREAGTTLLCMPGANLRALLLCDPAVAQAFALQLAFRSRLLHERLAADPATSLEARLARLVLTLARLYGEPDAQGLTLTLKVSQTDLADWLGTSRQSVNIALQVLREENLIHLRYSTVTVVDMARLTAKACF